MTAKKQTKAERIFRETYAESRNHIRTWCFDENAGWSGLVDSKEEAVHARTLNAIDKLIDAELRSIEHMERFTLKHPSGDDERDLARLESYTIRKQALTMTRNTVESVRRSEREFKEMLAAL